MTTVISIIIEQKNPQQQPTVKVIPLGDQINNLQNCLSELRRHTGPLTTTTRFKK